MFVRLKSYGGGQQGNFGGSSANAAASAGSGGFGGGSQAQAQAQSQSVGQQGYYGGPPGGFRGPPGGFREGQFGGGGFNGGEFESFIQNYISMNNFATKGVDSMAGLKVTDVIITIIVVSSTERTTERAPEDGATVGDHG